jgi:hypothetical protein
MGHAIIRKAAETPRSIGIMRGFGKMGAGGKEILEDALEV